MSHTRTQPRWVVPAAVLLVLVAASAWFLRPGGAPPGEVIQTIRSGDLDIAVSARGGVLTLGASDFTLTFSSTTSGDLVDVGTVRLAGAMPMPGMVMSGDVTVTPAGTGVYQATGRFGMAGTWNMTLEWDGPAGQGSAAFDGNVQ